MKRILYYLLYTIVYLLSLLPFWCLYLLSDIMFVIVYHLARYRRRIVWRNLTSSFPEKTEGDLHIIERQFYHWFCDYVFETFKLLSISDEQLLRHIEFRNIDELEACFDRGQNCAAILGHYCNWEWLSASGLVFNRYPDAVMGLIYHPLYNKAVDRLFIDSKKNLWVKNYDEGFYFYNPKTGAKTLTRYGYGEDEIPKEFWVSSYAEYDNKLIVASSNGELLAIDGGRGKVVWRDDYMKKNGGQTNSEYRINIDDFGNFWVLSNGVVYIFNSI